MLEITNDSTHRFERDRLFKKWGQFTRDLNVHMYGDVEKRKLEKVLTEDEVDNIQNSIELRKSVFGYPKSGCFANIWITSREAFKEDGVLSIVYGWSSLMTVFLLPYVHPTTSSVKAKLIDVTTEKVLKEYQLKEKSYHVVTTNPLIMLVPQVWKKKEVNCSRSESSGSCAKSLAQKKLIEAMLRTVTNDAYNFPECKKH